MTAPNCISRIAATCIAALGLATAQAQDYPARPIQIITTAAGGGGDFTARQVAQGIAPGMGQPVVVENRANTFIAAEAAIKAPHDGYTLLMVGSTLWILPLLRPQQYDVARDFAPVSQIEQSINILAVNPGVAARSVKELIDLAKARPGVLNYGTASIGSTSHLAMELFNHSAGISITNVPYKGAAQAVAGAVAGDVQVYISDVGTLMPQIKAGKLRALAVTSAQPSATAPDLPTVTASGVPGYEVTNMTGLFAPSRTPAPIINRLYQEVARAIGRPEVKERFLNLAVDTVASTPQQFSVVIKTDTARMAKVIKEAGIKVE